MKRTFSICLYVAVLICEAFAEEKKHLNIFKNDVSRNDFVRLLSSLIKVNEQRLNEISKTNKLQDYGAIAENKSDSVSTGLSLEDSMSKHDKTVPPIPERQEVLKKDLYEIFDDFRTNDPEVDPEIFRDDFNSHIEVIDRQKNQLNFERDGFHNTPKLNKNTARLRIKNKHLSATRTTHSRLHKTTNSEFDNDLLVNILNPRKSHSFMNKNVAGTQSINDLEPKISKSRQRKHKPIEPFSDVSDEFSTSNAEFISNLKISKNSKEHKKSDTFKKLVNKHKNKLPRLNKRRKPRNRNDSENRHEKRNYSGIPIEGKEYNEVRHIQPELDIALKQAEVLTKRKKHDTQNRKGLRSILRSLTTDFVTSKAELTTEIPILKNVNGKSKPNKDEFTLTMIDTNENQGQSKTENSHLGSSLLDMDASMYQHLLRQKPHGPNKVSSRVSKDLQNKKADSLKSTLISSLIAKQQPVEIGINDESKIEPYDKLGEKVESDQKVKNFNLGVNSNEETESIVTDKSKVDPIKPLRQADYEKDAKPYKKHKPYGVKTIKPKIAKKNFDIPLTMNDKQDKITSKEDKVDLNDDFSKAEIVLTDSNESDERSGDGFITVDQSDHEDSESIKPIKHLKEDKGIGNVLRYSRRGIRSKKSFRKCRRACIGAYTSVCRRLRCSPKAKKNFKYQCRKSCKRTFGKRKYSSSEK